MRKLDLKLVVGLVLLSVIATSAIWYVWAATPTATFWISPGIYPNSKAYTIWIEGSNYFAKDASGQIEFSGTNISLVFQNVIDQLVLPSSERTIAVREGVYLFDVGLLVSEYFVQIFGCGRRTILRANADMDYLLRIEDANSLLHLEHLCLDGYDKATTTLDLSRASTSAARVAIHNSWVFGGKTVDINTTNREEIGIFNSYIGSEDYTTDYPLYCGSAGGFTTMMQSSVVGGSVASVYYTGVQFKAVLSQFGAHPDYGDAKMIHLTNYSSYPFITLTNCHFERRNDSHVAIYSVAPSGSSRPMLYLSDSTLINPIQGNYSEISISASTIAISGSFSYGIECDYCGILYGNARIYQNTSITSGKWNLYNLYYTEVQSGSA